MPIPDASKIHLEVIIAGVISAGGSNTKNTNTIFHYRRTSAVNPFSKTAFDTAFQAAVAVPMIACLNARWSQQNNSVRCIDDAQDGYQTVSHVNAGGVAGDSMTTFTSAFLLLRTGLRGKSYRGNKHIGPLSEADTTAGASDILNAAALARFATLAAAILGNVTDANGNIWTPQVFSRTLSQIVKNPTNVVANDVVSVAVNQRVGRMRRREVKSVY